MVTKVRETMPIGYDKLALNYGTLLDLSFLEGSGVITHDRAKPSRVLTQRDPGGGSFAWGNLPSGYPYLEFTTIGGGATDGVYLDCPAADTVDLDFITDDYTILFWSNWQSDGFSAIVVGRYGTELDGWDCFFNAGSSSLSLRHNHLSLTPNLSSQCFSAGWGVGVWKLAGIIRRGASLYPLMYRNGIPLEMSYEVTGMLDPDTCNRDLVVGCRNTKDANWFKGMLRGLRVWGRALSPREMLMIWNMERHWFGA